MRKRANTEKVREDVRELREQGCSYREIGRQLGISHEQARKHALDAGLTTLTPVPSGLGARGRRYWQHAQNVFALDRHEQEVLVQVCRLLDRADALRRDIAEHGVVGISPRGLRRTNPAVAEERQVSLAIGRLITLLELPAEDGSGPGISPARTKARHAAEARWAR